ncbi:MAG: carbon-nitrogen hydrolase family protein, partial [Ilumatobacteraceae bacterium]
MTEVRVAAAQFATTTDLGVNLETCLRAIDTAAREGADLVVLPEFANHISVYESAEHCREVAVDLGGDFLAACAERAASTAMHVVVTVTLRRADAVTVTNVMFGPGGELLGTSDKQILMGNERAFLAAGEVRAPVIDTAIGPIGMYSCMDGVTSETPRGLAVQGARLLTNSLNSFALDEAALHIPVRAAENEVFVVAANKVGPLLPA